MAKKTFESRVEEAKIFVENGEFKPAISTLKKAVDNNPELDIDDKVAELIVELESKVDETKKEVTAEDSETITFKVTAPFMLNCNCYEVGDTIKLPRNTELSNVKHVE